MHTHIDHEKIRAYFNAGCLVSKPESRVYKKYTDTFQKVFMNENLMKLYDQDDLYVIFIHQAILSGTILANLDRDKMIELSPSYNYPFHLYHEDVTAEKPERIDDSITFRHGAFHSESDWMENMPASDELKQWLYGNLIHV